MVANIPTAAMVMAAVLTQPTAASGHGRVKRPMILGREASSIIITKTKT